jgi:hypothetical protein
MGHLVESKSDLNMGRYVRSRRARRAEAPTELDSPFDDEPFGPFHITCPMDESNTLFSFKEQLQMSQTETKGRWGWASKIRTKPYFAKGPKKVTSIVGPRPVNVTTKLNGFIQHERELNKQGPVMMTIRKG